MSISYGNLIATALAETKLAHVGLASRLEYWHGPGYRAQLQSFLTGPNDSRRQPMTMHNFDDSELSRRIDEIIQAHADDPEPCIDEIVAEVLWHHGDLVEKHKDELAEARIRAIDSGSVLDELTLDSDDDPYEDDPEMLRKRIELNTAKLRAAEAFYAKLQPIFEQHPGITTGEAVALLNQQAREQEQQAGQAE